MARYFGSSRWDREDTRRETDSTLHLDVRFLARRGMLTPGNYELNWTQATIPVGAISVRFQPGEPEAVTLVYAVEEADQTPRPVIQRVALARTPCHFGGTRPWFRCPGCQRRRAVLYGVGGVFRCRVCHNLAYSSSRETTMYRMVRRAEAIQGKLGGRETAASTSRRPGRRGCTGEPTSACAPNWKHANSGRLRRAFAVCSSG